jgi:hypothetical protein
MTDLTATRDEFVAYVRRQLVGPFGGSSGVIFVPPNRRYLMGILFPKAVAFASYVAEEGEDEDEGATEAGGEESQFADDPVSAANDFLPASQGFSFFTTAQKLTVRARAAEYETLSGKTADEAVIAAQIADAGPTEEQDEDPKSSRGSRRVWRRIPLAEATATIGASEGPKQVIWNGKAEIHVRWRTYTHGSLVTVTLVNGRTADGEGAARNWDSLLMQTEFAVAVADEGEILEYPTVSMASHDPEEEELRLIHRDAKVSRSGTAARRSGRRSTVPSGLCAPRSCPLTWSRE